MELRDEVLEILFREIPRVLKTELPDLNADTNFKTELGMKSFELANMLAAVEDEYDAYIKYTSLIHCNTVGDMADAIAKQLS
ncbi:MAG: acyl carrier protein [Parasporobacterium sp.]|nr:acyl carrier protein [Parasporobacterium sp.]